MGNRSRISSVINTAVLDSGLTGVESFKLSELKVNSDLDFNLPIDIRLGHLVEKIVSELIKTSDNYHVLYENVQIVENKITIGEIDFLIRNLITDQITHVELAYKFYLYDPRISPKVINNWIGPNRNDSLMEKLKRLKANQFPLLNHKCAGMALKNVDIKKVSQRLCFLVSLYIPYEFAGRLDPIYRHAIKGYYLGYESFINQDNLEKTYYVPSKKEWGIDPAGNENWADLKAVRKTIATNLKENQSVLCWQKSNDSYSSFFIVWW